MARPTKYTEEIADKICNRIADGESLRSICKDDTIPDKATVFRWLSSNNEFRDQYARAKECQADYYADELIELADTFAEEQDTPTAVSRAKLQIDTRKWVASKLKPKIYGDKLTQEVTGANGGAIKVENKQDLSNLTDEELQLLEQLAELRSKRDQTGESET